MDNVLEEITVLALQGVREVTLLGQNVNAYRPTGGGDFADLLSCVSQIPEIARIRFTTSHPVEFSDRLIAAYANLEKITDHVHLPVQSGSDRILAAMKRGYTVLEYKSIIRKLRRIRPDISVTSDFIIGFPGESEQDFIKTLDLVTISILILVSVLFTVRVPVRRRQKCRMIVRWRRKNRVWRGCRKNWTPTAVDSAKRWWGGKRKFWWKGNPKNERVKCKAEPPIIAW